jgi:hypothetical protein
MRAFLRRCWHALTTIPPVDLIDPPSAEDRAAKARADRGERQRHHGLATIMRVSQAEVIDLAERRKQSEARDEIVGYAFTFKQGGQ